MTKSFDGQGAVITGAGVGIGYEIARRLAKAGAGVILNDIDAEAAHTAAEAIREAGGACAVVVGDASDLTVIGALVHKAVEAYGNLSVTVANAGITTYGTFLKYTPEEFEQLMAVNLRGTFFLAQKAAQQMTQQAGGGDILLMSSVTGVQAHPNLTAYGMTKAAIRMLAKSLGVELAPHGITVNAIAPGATLTERTLGMEGYTREWSDLTPTGRPATTDDIANAALFLLGAGSRQITGQTLVVDGGWTAYSPPPDDV